MSFNTEEELDNALRIMSRAEDSVLTELHKESKDVAPETTPKFQSIDIGLISYMPYNKIKEDDFLDNPDFEEIRKVLFYSFLEQQDERIEKGFFRNKISDTQWKNWLDKAKKFDFEKGPKTGSAAVYVPKLNCIFISRLTENMARQIEEEFVEMAKSEGIPQELIESARKFPYKISKNFEEERMEVEITYTHELTHYYVWNRVDKPIPEVDEALAHVVSGYLREGEYFGTFPKKLLKYKKKGYDHKIMAVIMMLAKVKLGQESNKNKSVTVVDWVRKKEAEITEKGIETPEKFVKLFNPRRYGELKQLDELVETDLERIFSEIKPSLENLEKRGFLKDSGLSLSGVKNDFNRAHEFLKNPEKLVFNLAIEEYMNSRKIDEKMTLRRTFNKMMDDVLEQEIENLVDLQRDFEFISERMSKFDQEDASRKFKQAYKELNKLEKNLQS